MGNGGHWPTGKSQHVSGPTTETPLVGDDGPRVPRCRASLTSQGRRHKGRAGSLLCTCRSSSCIPIHIVLLSGTSATHTASSDAARLARVWMSIYLSEGAA